MKLRTKDNLTVIVLIVLLAAFLVVAPAILFPPR